MTSLACWSATLCTLTQFHFRLIQCCILHTRLTACQCIPVSSGLPSKKRFRFLTLQLLDYITAFHNSQLHQAQTYVDTLVANPDDFCRVSLFALAPMIRVYYSRLIPKHGPGA